MRCLNVHTLSVGHTCTKTHVSHSGRSTSSRRRDVLHLACRAPRWSHHHSRDERSRHPSLGLPRVEALNLTEAGRYFPASELVAQTSGTFFSIQAGCTSKPLSDFAAGACSSFSSRATQSVTCFGLEMFLPIARAQTVSARRQARLPDMRLWPTPAARRPA